MSIDLRSTHRSQSSSRHVSRPSTAAPRQTPPPAVLTPENSEQEFEPSAATGSFLLYAQRSTILVLHHDTLAIERRFELHREDVRWIVVDNVSERGSGRLAVSYDTGNTAIVWDIFSGAEVARFSAYDAINIACFMRNGNIAFGNVQGSIILFEPATSEHISARTIFDPITSIAPATDCRSFAIGYLNGSILVATIQPAFTILHTLTTSRTPSKITGLAWHGSSSKSKTDMLAAQTADGDLRVWSVPKTAGPEQPMIIRVLNRADMPIRGANWFAWSKNGRIVQYLDGETRAWDVRTKKVTFDIIPTIEGVTSICNYGPTATLFTLGRGHTVQQYDINPNNSPMQVGSVQHMPATTPPTPPTNFEENKNPYSDVRDFGGIASLTDNESSEDEPGKAMSPLERIAPLDNMIAREFESLDMLSLEREQRDVLMPLSPTTSSRASTTSSRSSGRGYRQRKYLYDKPDSSRGSTTSGRDGTEFSFGISAPRGNDNISIRSSTSMAPSKARSSHLRNQILRSPQETEATANVDLFPYLRQRLQEVDFRTPHYGNTARTADILRREMLSGVFGWNDDVPALIRDEMSRHRTGSASSVLLAKWLGDEESSSMAALVGSESMTSSDWMLLALSSIQVNSQKQVGEAFVQRLLEKGDVHPAVAILIGMGEYNDAIEVYVSQNMYMEALLLCALYMPSDWGRQSFLLRKWGEVAVKEGNPELAVRIFSCGSVESTDNWFSPRAQQDAAYASAQQQFGMQSPDMMSPPLSPPSRTASGRLKAKNASLKLITSFNGGGAPIAGDPTPLAIGVTPIVQSAMSPGGAAEWKTRRRDDSQIRTATPGGYSGRKRLPSRSDIERAKQEAAEMATPLTAARSNSRAPSMSRSRRQQSMSRSIDEPSTALRSKADITIVESQEHLPSPSAAAFNRLREGSRNRASSRERNPGKLAVQVMDTQYDDTPSPAGSRNSPPLTSMSSRTNKTRATDSISSVEEARAAARHERAASRSRMSKSRNESRSRGTSRPREQSETRKKDVRSIRAPKKSPASPKPMSPEDYMQAQPGASNTDDENFYRITSPVEPMPAMTFAQRQHENDDTKLAPGDSERGRRDDRSSGTSARSPSAPVPIAVDMPATKEPDTESDGRRVRTRAASKAGQDLQHRRAVSTQRARSSSRAAGDVESTTPPEAQDAVPALRPRVRTKEEAARELEERRLSLARRPSAPAIPLPSELSRPNMLARTNTELGNSPTSYLPPLSRAATVDPEAMLRYGKVTGTATPSTPIGLPATPRAMRHPKYMSAAPDKDDTPPVPEIPESLSNFSGSVLSSGSALSQAAPSSLSQVSSVMTPDRETGDRDGLGPLLPSTVYKGPILPSRSASAPPEKMSTLLTSSVYKPSLPANPRGHFRKISPPDVTTVTAPGAITSIDSALQHDDADQIIIIPEEPENMPTLLPELQHLAGPPPPPPAPSMFSQVSSGTINIAIDGNESNLSSDMSSALSQAPSQFPQALERAMTTSPATASRRRGSVSGESLTSRMRGVADRMRSSSKNRIKSPAGFSQPMPYETVLPHERKDSTSRVGSPFSGTLPYETILPQPGSDALTRARSPYEQSLAGKIDQVIPPPPPAPLPPQAGMEHVLNEKTIPPNRAGSAVNGYRNPKEIRANMPPDFTQAGVQGGFL